MKLNARHTTEKTMPTAARMEKMTMMGIATATSCSIGTPSYGITPPGIQVMGENEGTFSSVHISYMPSYTHTHTHNTHTHTYTHIHAPGHKLFSTSDR